MFYRAAASAATRSSRVVNFTASTDLIRNGSMIVRKFISPRRLLLHANTETMNPAIVTVNSSTPTTQSAVPENVNSIVLTLLSSPLDG